VRIGAPTGVPPAESVPGSDLSRYVHLDRTAKRDARQEVTDDDLFQFVTTGPIVQEVLQGMRHDNHRTWLQQLFLAIPRVSDPVPIRRFLEAADIYARGRRQGYSIRSSTDCLLAAIAMENGLPVWHRDRDFSAIARFTSLRASDRLEQVRY
jgi:predicted nucleic acid-binding protein